MPENASSDKKQEPPPYYNPKILKFLCWGMLLHMIDEPNSKEEILNWVRRLPNNGNGHDSNPNGMGSMREMAKQLSGYNEQDNPMQRAKKLKEIVSALGKILDPEESKGSPLLWKEAPRGKEPRTADEGPSIGYSRYPYRKIDPENKPQIALAAISYLLRAHAYFFFKHPIKRDFNAAKVALNDLFQASQFGCRLYYSLEESHLKKFNQKAYFDRVIKVPDFDGLLKNLKEYNEAEGRNTVSINALKEEKVRNFVEPWNSPFFIWWIMQQVEIQRGNVYRKIEYIEEADRHYRHAQERFDRLCGDSLRVDEKTLIVGSPDGGKIPDVDKYFVTTTMVKALFERSKILFDRGLFIESIMNQIRCLAYLIRMVSTEKHLGEAGNGILLDINDTMTFLDIVRKQSVWDKEKITKFFNYPVKDEIEKDGIEIEHRPDGRPFVPLTPERFTEALTKEEKEGTNRRHVLLAHEILTRLGFTLYQLRRQKISLGARGESQDVSYKEYVKDTSEEVVDWLVGYFTSHEGLKLEGPCSLARYCMTFITPKKTDKGVTGETEKVIFKDALERQLAYLFKDSISKFKNDDDGDRELEFYRGVSNSIMENIGNIVTVPHRVQGFFMHPGYKHRRTKGDMSHSRVDVSMDDDSPGHKSEEGRKENIGVQNKLVILRRWQSYNPKVPRPDSHSVRGGGYFLMWQNKGIVIDPGFDFIQNFYEEGFSLDDIDAVIITHSHPDHDDDLSSLTTLVREWNEHQSQMGYSNQIKLDLFLNESTHLKFSSWLKASGEGIGRVMEMPLVVWNIDSREETNNVRGENVRMNLRKVYKLDLEVVPAWHDDVIGSTAAVGLKFHLYEAENGKDGETENEGQGRQEKKIKDPIGIIGYTGDTGFYGRDSNAPLRIQEQYGNCDVLIAHLGDIKIRELATVMKSSGSKVNDIRNCFIQLLNNWFHDFIPNAQRNSPIEDKNNVKVRRKVESFLNLLLVLHMAPEKALEETIEISGKEEPMTVCAVLNQVIENEITTVDRETFKKNKKSLKSHLQEDVKKIFEKAIPNKWKNTDCEGWKFAYLLLAFLCASSYESWHYRYHLGISGLYGLYNSMVTKANDPKDDGHQRIFIIGELPEELTSYRHHIARLLNAIPNDGTSGNEREHQVSKTVHAFTGDIGLHINLLSNGGKLAPKIRCTYCNYNNETVLKGFSHYHDPDKIFETIVKRLDSRMIYLCTEHDHHPECLNQPFDFLSSPNMRVI